MECSIIMRKAQVQMEKGRKNKIMGRMTGK